MSKKKKQTEKILETLGTLNSVENKSLNQVYVNKKINHDLDILRAEYGPEVMRAVIFNIEHPLKEEYLIKVEEIKQKYYKIPYVEVIEEKPVEIIGEGKVSSLKLQNTDFKTDGVFVFVGYEPISQVFKGQIEMNAFGEIITDAYMNTNVPGVYAAGDIRQTTIRQIVTAAADGAVAATSCEKYIGEE